MLAAAALWSGLSVLRLRGELGGQRKLGAYRLGRSIGEGSVANVYLAHHDLLKRPCAVKLLKPARASDEMIARFEREVQLASQLSHPNVVEIYDYGRSTDGLFYYAMEYLDGINLGELVACEGPVPVERAVRILRQVCAGLAAAQPIPVELDLLVQACLEKRREDRPQRVADLIEALDSIALEATAPGR